MKRYGNLFEKVFSIDNLHLAYLDARKGKRSRRACFEFEKHLGENLHVLHTTIHAGTYIPDPYFQFIVYEPKRRIIHAPTFRDVVVQHAIYRIIYKIFDRVFVSTSFACRVGYGTHRASRYTRQAMRKYEGEDYILKLDIRKFFYSIKRSVLRGLIEQKIKDSRLVDIMMMFADMETPLGIPIGNLLSQIYALIYLNPLDHFIKRVLKIQDYVRYVDDFMLIGLSREKCLLLRDTIVKFLQSFLGLALSKCTIQKIRKGVNFCGYRTWRSLTFIRKYSLYRFRRVVKAGKQDSINSLLGHAKYTNSLPYMLNILKEEMIHGKNLQIPKNFRPIYYALSCRAGL
jgi:retron-type reverse transcriptase